MIKIKVANINEIHDEFVERIIATIKPRHSVDKDFPNKGCELHSKIILMYELKLEEVNKDNYDGFIKFLDDNGHNKDDIAKKYFNYKYVIGYELEEEINGYWLAKKLGVTVCPYCNRQYTFTIQKHNKDHGTRPQFDHFHSKDAYPFFSLSFYNLVPSCPICNIIKSTKPIGINPYIKGFEDCKFHITNPINCILDGNNYNWKIKPKNTNGKNKSNDKKDEVSNGKWEIEFKNVTNDHYLNVEVFALAELYNEHKDYVQEIVFKACTYNDDYYQSLMESFSDLGLSKSEMKLMIFGNYVDPEDYGKRPLSKLTAEILEQLLD